MILFKNTYVYQFRRTLSDDFNFWYTLFSKMMPNTIRKICMIIFFSVSYFFSKNKSDFVSLAWKLENRYCHKWSKYHLMFLMHTLPEDWIQLLGYVVLSDIHTITFRTKLQIIILLYVLWESVKSQFLKKHFNVCALYNVHSKCTHFPKIGFSCLDT